MRRLRVLQFISLLSVCASPPLISQPTITYRPELDTTRFARRFQIYPSQHLKRPRVGLVLSGGGARGAAQIGVLKALEENNIPIDFIAATSMGAIVGGLYAAGYTTAELESLVVGTNWDELLSLSDEAKRVDLALDQKLAADWSFLVVRFQGLQPVLPHAVSSGQRLTNFLNEKTLQALYHPHPSFDDLKIPFRAATTDLVSGKRIVLGEGSLAEALRATATVPLLFNPVEKDSMQLIDGGLVTNIPVDIAKDAGCDIVVAVNSTSGLRKEGELQAPWQTADQIMGIMMQLSNDQQLQRADVVITPDIGRHLSSDFKGLDSLIQRGYGSALAQVDSIRRLYDRASQKMDSAKTQVFANASARFIVDNQGSYELNPLKDLVHAGRITSADIKRNIRELHESGSFAEVRAEVYANSSPPRIDYFCALNPTLKRVEFLGNALLPTDSLRSEFKELLNKPLNHRTFSDAIERVLRRYRARGYSLARATGGRLDEESGTFSIELNEGAVERIGVMGGVRTENSFMLREFGVKEGEVFDIKRAQEGITNINSTNLFDFVYLEVAYNQQKPVLTIRISEYPSQLVRFGMRADDERNLQGTIDIRDENFRGLGAELGLTVAGGGRNALANLEFRSNRLFSSLFTFNIGLTYSLFDSYVYADDPTETRANRWSRRRAGEYSDIRYGGRLLVGAQLKKFGNVTVEYLLQQTRIKSIDNTQNFGVRHTLSMLKTGTVIDSRNRYPFPSGGVHTRLSYEFASTRLGSDIGYTALRFLWENYASWGDRSTFHPRLTFGFGDITMPLAQQFRLGGRESMFGTREDDRRGRQMLVLNIEYRYRMPIRFAFDTYVRVRYDLATISDVPEQIKFNLFRHGIGMELALDTPLGEAALGVGNSFYFEQGLKENSMKRGPLLLYLTLGYDL